MEYLTSLGHRRIAHWTTPEDIITVTERERGYRDGLAAAGLPIDPALIIKTAYSEMLAKIKEVTLALRETADAPTAVFALQEAMAHYFMTRADEIGWSVPEKVSVVGFDDLDQYSPRPAILTTVRQPFELMGRRAAELALHRLANPSRDAPFQRINLSTRLIVRSTCRAVQ